VILPMRMQMLAQSQGLPLHLLFLVAKLSWVVAEPS